MRTLDNLMLSAYTFYWKFIFHLTKTSTNKNLSKNGKGDRGEEERIVVFVVRSLVGNRGYLSSPSSASRKMVNYYLLRRAKVNLDDLYREGARSEYWYRGGVNPKALIIFFPTAAFVR